MNDRVTAVMAPADPLLDNPEHFFTDSHDEMQKGVRENIYWGARGQLAIEYVDSFREAGISPLDTLRALTTRAASLLGVDKVRGAIRAGMAADLVATPADPLRDIDGLKKINFVMKDGHLCRTP